MLWFVAHLEDVRSDMSTYHRIEDMECMPSDRFFSFAERLPSYTGACQARYRLESAQREQNGGVPQQRAAVSAQPRRKQRALHSVSTGPGVELDDEGRRIEHGVAVDPDGTPSWVRKRARSLGISEIDVVPGDASALGFSAAFSGLFSSAKVSRDERGDVVVQDR